MLVVGAKEAESDQVSYRDRIDGDRGAMPLAQAVAQLKAESESRTIRQTATPIPTLSPTQETAEKHAY